MIRIISATVVGLLLLSTPSHAQRRSSVLGLGLVATAIATVAASQNRKAYAAPSARRATTRTARASGRRTASTGRVRATSYRSGGGGGGGGGGGSGYVYTPPSNPNPHGLYGAQPAYAPCTRYTLNVDGTKHCF